jgi:exodeoxyribonuclease-1
LRPDGLQWPRDDAGRLSFRLEKLTAANGIAHEGAHDALSDVRASIDLARLLKSRQPRLWEHLWNHRGKAAVEEQLALGSFVPLLHVSEKYPAEQHCLAVVVALSRHPRNASEIVVFDLSVDPEPLLTLSAEEIRQRVFTRVVDLPDGVSRIPLKTVRINRCPVVLPMKVLRGEDAERLAIDMKRCQRHLLQLQQATGLAAKLDQVFAAGEFAEMRDPDRMLYSGGFLSDADRRKMTWVREASPQNLADSPPSFQDARLGEMLFRYRARNFPESLNAEEHARWEEYRRQRLTDPDFGASLVQAEFHRQLNALEATSTLSPDQRTILDQLRDYEREIFG